jgi:hypothetical protein
MPVTVHVEDCVLFGMWDCHRRQDWQSWRDNEVYCGGVLRVALGGSESVLSSRQLGALLPHGALTAGVVIDGAVQWLGCFPFTGADVRRLLDRLEREEQGIPRDENQ